MDIFSEYIVSRRMRGADYAIMAVIAMIAAVLSCYIFMFIPAYPNWGGILAVVIAGVWWGAYKIAQRRNIEFEYILTNHELDIDKIVSRNSRKRLCTINFNKIERCASITDPSFKDTNGLSVKNYAGDMSAKAVYFVDYATESGRVRVIFQPNRKIIEGIKKTNPKCVTVLDKDLPKED